jgi:heat shock protein HtpX
MTNSRYLPDRGLSARMGFTIFLLGLLFVVLGAVLINYFGY